eukprot:TRINITY_DN11846_c0_g1_i1.p1 TRINITY_DN11846_c0_g1~~TRINITY_DN11846_c0_g1_i1.p1  ORF type:complete len:124 (-),score=4.43 TRINITY_DN11846_c0_g1_i1:102-473(-)
MVSGREPIRHKSISSRNVPPQRKRMALRGSRLLPIRQPFLLNRSVTGVGNKGIGPTRALAGPTDLRRRISTEERIEPHEGRLSLVRLEVAKASQLLSSASNLVIRAGLARQQQPTIEATNRLN